MNTPTAVLTEAHHLYRALVFAPDTDKARWLLQRDPGLPLSQLKAVIDELRERTPEAGHPHRWVYTVAPGGADPQRINWLADQTLRLKRAGIATWPRDPTRFHDWWMRIIAETPQFRPAWGLVSADACAQVTALSLQDDSSDNDDLWQIGEYVRVVQLSLFCKDLSSLQVSFAHLDALRALTVSGNPLVVLPDSLWSAPNLELLDVSNCPLGGLPSRLPPRLRWLDVRGTPVTRAELEALKCTLPHCTVHHD